MAKMDMMRNTDSKIVVPYHPHLDVFRTVRMSDSSVQNGTWNELNR